MISQSLVYFKTGKRPITVSQRLAEKISEQVSDEYVNDEAWIKVGGESFRKHQIDRVSIQKDLPDPKETHAEDMKKFYADESIQRAGILKDENRYSDLSYFELICQSLSIKVTQELQNKAVEIQREFFAKHTRRTICSPQIYYQIFPGNFKEGLLEESNIKDVLRSSAIKLIGLALYRDRHLSKDFS
jgi:hypothetical protein